MSKLQKYRSKALEAVKANRQSARTAVHVIEVIAGAYAGGYVSEAYGDMAGIPTDAGAGLILAGVGYGMKQPDLAWLGVGMLAGYAHDKGRTMATPKN
jgi:hypothetical protein